jgi:hypothetical protein
VFKDYKSSLYLLFQLHKEFHETLEAEWSKFFSPLRSGEYRSYCGLWANFACWRRSLFRGHKNILTNWFSLMIVIILPTNAQLFFIIYIYIYTHLAYMFRPYPVIIRALRYTKGFRMCLKYLRYIRTFLKCFPYCVCICWWNDYNHKRKCTE